MDEIVSSHIIDHRRKPTADYASSSEERSVISRGFPTMIIDHHWVFFSHYLSKNLMILSPTWTWLPLEKYYTCISELCNLIKNSYNFRNYKITVGYSFKQAITSSTFLKRLTGNGLYLQRFHIVTQFFFSHCDTKKTSCDAQCMNLASKYVCHKCTIMWELAFRWDSCHHEM